MNTDTEDRFQGVDSEYSGWRSQDSNAQAMLNALVYRELRRLATTYMRRERSSHTLQATALVNEALARVAGSSRRLSFADRQHFFATTARVMRRVLVDHAKRRRATKRQPPTVTGSPSILASAMGQDGGIDLVELNDAIEKLAQLSHEAARVLELHYFAGLSIEDTAQILNVSASTVGRNIRFAKAWLLRELSDSAKGNCHD